MNMEHFADGSEFDHNSVRDYLARCSKMDEDRNHYIMDALKHLERTESRLRELTLELEDQKDSRCRYQQEAKQLKTKLDSLDRRIAKAAFVVVLIDGDGAKFTDELLQSEDAGGAEAGRRLREAVRQYLSSGNPELAEEDTPVLVNIWANLDDLPRVLYNNGSIRAKEDMLSFARGFSRSRAEFSFVNVGKGKEKADNKMRRMLDFYYNDLHCKKIIFAGCHDAGYLNDLQQKHGSKEAQQRLVLLETTPAEPDFKSLEFPTTRFDAVFRREPLDCETKQPRRGALSGSGMQPHPTSLSVRPSLPLSSETPSVQGQKTHEQIVHRPTNVKVSNNGGLSINYATVGRDTEQKNVVISAVNKKEPKFILYNAALQRLDLPNKRTWGEDAQRSYNAKMTAIKPKVFCNDFYLTGDCPWRGSCDREHDLELTHEERTIHRYRARTGPCIDGPACRKIGCYSSHHCPLGQNCRKGSNCIFSKTYHGDLHLRNPDDLKPLFKLVEDKETFQKIQ